MKKFDQLLTIIYKKSTFQKKRIQKLLQKRDALYFVEAETFAEDYVGYLNRQGVPIESAVDSYLGLCADTLKCQIQFSKTGKYPTNSQSSAVEKVYNNEAVMMPYMIGLGISQFLWETHYRMYSFFSRYLKMNGDGIKSYLEIGPGHGLFLKKAIECIPVSAKISVVDISPISIKIVQSIIDYFSVGKSIVYHNADIFEIVPDRQFDFITMGEVLEHVSRPQDLLRKLYQMVAPTGKVFVSTCVNAPAIDHLYHFRNVQEIRDMVESEKLTIEDELVLPVEDLPMDEIVSKKITINYCAIIKRV
jgi:ubiquinone/menaquinone biosynthesis C-methylase UbiE